MPRLPEPDDVDFFIAGADPSPDAVRETNEAIAEIKRRPDYPDRKAQAALILADLGINPHDYGMATAQSLLDHWRRCAGVPESVARDRDDPAIEDNPSLESTNPSDRVPNPQ